MNKIKDELINNIYKTVQIQPNEIISNNKEENENLEISMINKDLQGLSIHKSIKCNECNCPEIIGPRFKCIKCENYNLCSKCEEETEHNIDHIFIKIYKSNQDSEIDNHSLKIKYKNEGLNYNVSQNNFRFKRKITNTIKLQIKNTGTKNWDNGFTFHCLDKHSELLGMSYNIMHVVEPQNDVDATLIFNLDDNQNCLNDITRSLFVSYWQMFDKNDLPFGEVTNNL
jgi:hypothetical protein